MIVPEPVAWALASRKDNATRQGECPVWKMFLRELLFGLRKLTILNSLWQKKVILTLLSRILAIFILQAVKLGFMVAVV